MQSRVRGQGVYLGRDANAVLDHGEKEVSGPKEDGNTRRLLVVHPERVDEALGG